MNMNPRRILIIATPVMGDVLLSTPVIRSVRAAWPDAQIEVLTRPGGGAVLEGNPDVTGVIELHKKPPVRKLLAFLIARFRKYDLVLSNSASDRALIYSLVMGKRRVSLVYAAHKNVRLKERLYDHSSLIEYERLHTIEQNLSLLDPLGIERRYDVTLPRSATSAATLRAELGDDWAEQRFAVIHPNSAGPYKRWHKAGWERTVRHLHDRGLRVLVSGSPAATDIDYIESLGLDTRPAESLAGKLSLADLSLLLEKAQIYVGVDTLITHIAAAAGTPTVALFGPVSPLTWGPWPQGFGGGDSPWRHVGSQKRLNVTVVQGVKSCVPCGQAGCERRLDSYSECLDELSAEAVIAAVDERLGG